MADSCRQLCSLCTKKEAFTVILWYATFMSAPFAIISFQHPQYLNNNTTITDAAMNTSVIVFFLFLGLFADTFIGRYRMIQFSLWVQFLAVTMSTLMTALLLYYEYYLHDWPTLVIILCSMLDAIEYLALASFQVVAIQFGLDQLQGTCSKPASQHIHILVFHGRIYLFTDVSVDLKYLFFHQY